MARCSCLTGRSPGSFFGLMRWEEELLGSLMTISALRVRPPSGVSCGYDLTGSNDGDSKEREWEPDDKDVVNYILLGVQELPRRRGRVLVPGRIAVDGIEGAAEDAPPLTASRARQV
ncbi:hypothetical protein D1007_48683 [Hordeum vulgare]|nr:hypothetical protein D1007_48683 [Hordeum vulgare]